MNYISVKLLKILKSMQLFFLCWLSELSLEVLWLLKRTDDTEFPGLEEGSYNRCQFDVSEIARFFFFLPIDLKLCFLPHLSMSHCCSEAV